MNNSLTSGIIKYGVKETSRSERGKIIGSSFVERGRLVYQEVSCRDQDYEIARILAASLDLKIKTLYPPMLRDFDKTKLLVTIKDVEYDVIRVDSDQDKRNLYFYLQRVR